MADPEVIWDGYAAEPPNHATAIHIAKSTRLRAYNEYSKNNVRSTHRRASMLRLRLANWVVIMLRTSGVEQKLPAKKTRLMARQQATS